MPASLTNFLFMRSPILGFGGCPLRPLFSVSQYSESEYMSVMLFCNMYNYLWAKT